MTMVNEIVFLLDVDNTLLDNDRITTDLDDHLAQTFGDESRDRYWEIFEALRVELGYADYLGALQRYRVSVANDPRLLMMSSFLVDYPFGSDRNFDRWRCGVSASQGTAVGIMGCGRRAGANLPA